VRFSWFDSRPVDEYLGVKVAPKKSGQRLCIAHPNEEADLACIPLRISVTEAGRDNLRIGLHSEDFASADDYYQGAPVIALAHPLP
jgi:hypothetical protein